MQPASLQSYIQKAEFSIPLPFVLLAFILTFPIDDLVALLVRLCLLALIVSGSRRYLNYLPTILLIGWLFLSVLWSVSPSKSLAGTFQFCAYCLLYLTFRYQRVHKTPMLWGLRLLVSVAIFLSIYGVHQLLYGYDAYFYTIEHTAESLLPASQATTRAWLDALAGRVFSRFALPSQFAVYLLMMFPVHAVLILHERRKLLKILWGIGFILNVIMFGYTKSFGAWVTLFGLIVFGLILVLLRRRLFTWRTFCTGSLGLLLLGGVGLYAIGNLRGQHLWDFQSNNPLWLRVLNWKVAVSMWRDHVFLGTGISTFGLLYPQYMPPGANESNYAHNSYLQIGVEHGLAGLLLIFWLIFAWGHRALTLLKKQPLQHSTDLPIPTTSRTFFTNIRYAGAFGGLAFLLHNIIDFDLYVFPLGAIGIALLALTINSGQQPVRSQQSHRYGWVAACIGCGLVLVGVVDWQQMTAQQHYTAARNDIQAQRYDEAEKASHDALQSWLPLPAYHAFAGSVALYQQSPDTARQHFQRAVQADPNTPWFHAGLAEAYLVDHNIGLAYAESRLAAERFPQKSEYGQRTREIQKAFPAF